MPTVGQHLARRPDTADAEVAGHRTLHYRVATNGSFIDDMVSLLQRLYVPRTMAFEHPNWSLGDGRVPQASTVQVGDFGEALSYALMCQLGYEVPYVKLHSRTTRDATIQGPDTLCALVGSDIEILVETKTRTARVTSATVRTELEEGLRKDRDLFSSWTFAVQEFAHLPERRRVYAYQVACELADRHHQRLPRRTERHAVVVCPSDGVDGTVFWSNWPHDLPRCTLHVLEVGELRNVVQEVYQRLSALRFGDSIEGGLATGPLREIVTAHAPGNRAPLRASAARGIPNTEWSPSLSAAAQSACWYLADHDGYGQVAAGEEVAGRGISAVLVALLSGRIPSLASLDESAQSCAPLLEAVARCWTDGLHGPELRATAQDLASTLPDAEATAVRLTAAAIEYRLDRHPERFLPSTSPMSARLQESLRRKHIRAIWPGQAEALAHGLLDPNEPAFAVQMPTSAGKTLLIQLLTASSLDRDPSRPVVVLAPSRALVAQHARDLQAAFGRSSVTGFYGGYEVDATDGDVGADVTVMTPERFEIESRREARSGPSLRELQLLIVDEAHLLSDATRGARLELTVSRIAAASKCRVVLLSSHLGDPDTFLTWLRSPADSYLATSWRPAPLERGVFHTEGRHGVVRWEHATTPEIFVLVNAQDARRPPGLFSGSEPVPSRADRGDQLAALAIALSRRGPVLVFVPHAARVRVVAEDIRSRLDYLGRSPQSGLAEASSAIDEVDSDAARLLSLGIGIHHRGLHSEVRRAVERAARGGRLDIIVSTSTLAEGIDAPIETVLISSLQIAAGVRLQQTKLANLAGRAGRGGRYRAGRVVVRLAEDTDPLALQRELAASLPPTRSALARVFELLTRQVRESGIAAPFDGQRDVDDLLLTVLDNEVENDGQLRRAIEEILQRTLYAAERRDIIGGDVLDALEVRARFIAEATPDRSRRAAFHRTGLPYEICRELIEVLQGLDQAELLGDLTNRSTLITLLRAVAPVAAAHGLIDGLDVDELASAADRWTAGDDEASLIETYDNWHKLVGALDYEIAWCLSGAIDLLAHARGLDAGGRASLQQAAAVVRVRYGGPTVESCSVIRAGLARRRTLELLNEYLGRDIDDVWQAIATFREWLATYASLSEDEMLVLGIRTDE